ncbi:unnamed protein product [Prorocentrum cordatum]|uniref:PLOD1-3-like GT domain-containing protein n=1 Tax=Prorocentrum cordatum TaxID=2364126 RepID=A0ABN9XM72_9DINO|nr:unnamed protein product [Polarella glacialis]
MKKPIPSDVWVFVPWASEYLAQRLVRGIYIQGLQEAGDGAEVGPIQLGGPAAMVAIEAASGSGGPEGRGACCLADGFHAIWAVGLARNAVERQGAAKLAQAAALFAGLASRRRILKRAPSLRELMASFDGEAVDGAMGATLARGIGVGEEASNPVDANLAMAVAQANLHNAAEPLRLQRASTPAPVHPKAGEAVLGASVRKYHLEDLFSQRGEVAHASFVHDKRWKRQPMALGESKRHKDAKVALAALRAGYKFFASDDYQVATQWESEPPAVGAGSDGKEKTVPPFPNCEARGQQMGWITLRCTYHISARNATASSWRAMRWPGPGRLTPARKASDDEQLAQDLDRPPGTLSPRKRDDHAARALESRRAAAKGCEVNDGKGKPRGGKAGIARPGAGLAQIGASVQTGGPERSWRPRGLRMRPRGPAARAASSAARSAAAAANVRSTPAPPRPPGAPELPRAAHVIACCTEYRQETAILQRSATRNGFAFHAVGVGEPWGGFATKFLCYERALQALVGADIAPDDVVILTDAWDTVILGGVDELLAKVAAVPAGTLLCGSERVCGPNHFLVGRIEALYPEDRTPWRYPNSGGLVGPASVMQALMHALVHQAGSGRLAAEENDQVHLHEFLLDQADAGSPFPLQLDVSCSVFQCMYEEAPQWHVEARDDANENTRPRIVNNLTGERPVVAHGNGHTGRWFLSALFAEMRLLQFLGLRMEELAHLPHEMPVAPGTAVTEEVKAQYCPWWYMPGMHKGATDGFATFYMIRDMQRRTPGWMPGG